MVDNCVGVGDMPLVNFAEIGGIVVNTRVNYTSYDNIIIKSKANKVYNPNDLLAPLASIINPNDFLTVIPRTSVFSSNNSEATTADENYAFIENNRLVVFFFCDDETLIN